MTASMNHPGKRRFGQTFLDFFVFSNLFIAICAVLMLQHTFHFILHQPTNLSLAGLVFSATICSYSFHWWLTQHSELPSPRIQWVKKYKIIHFILFFAGLAGSVYFFWPLRRHWIWIFAAVLATFIYSSPKIPHPLFRRLRKFAYGKTIFLALVWMYVTTVLPLAVSGAGWDKISLSFAAGRFFYIYPICILFDYRDREDDRATGIRSLITYLDERGIRWLFYASLVIYLICSLLLLAYGIGLLPVTLLLVPAFILAWIYPLALRNFSDIFYYFVLDGLMVLPSILMLVAGI